MKSENQTITVRGKLTIKIGEPLQYLGEVLAAFVKERTDTFL